MDKILIADYSWIYNKFYYVATTLGKTDKEINHKHFEMLYNHFSSICTKGNSFDSIYVVCDGRELGSHEFRQEYEDYKSGRNNKDKNYKYLEQSLILLSGISKKLKILRNDSREADEIIAALAMKLHEKNEVIIYTGDKDLLQLTSLKNVYITEKRISYHFKILSDSDIFSKFKNSNKEDFTRISHDKSDIIKYRVFKGDSSDKIPAPIPRLYDKELIKIINIAWKEEGLNIQKLARMSVKLLSIGEDKLSKSLIQYRNEILRNYRLMNLINFNTLDYLKDTKVLNKRINRDKIKLVKEYFNINE